MTSETCRKNSYQSLISSTTMGNLMVSTSSSSFSSLGYNLPILLTSTLSLLIPLLLHHYIFLFVVLGEEPGKTGPMACWPCCAPDVHVLLQLGLG
uniref:Uncharacterized protein n=1 Tax=Triticum urartu TaxID=4572 RepID=A0A8R7V077_TRIUA